MYVVYVTVLSCVVIAFVVAAAADVVGVYVFVVALTE